MQEHTNDRSLPSSTFVQVVAQFRTTKRTVTSILVTCKDKKETSERPFKEEGPEELPVGVGPRNLPDTELELSKSFRDAVHRPQGLWVENLGHCENENDHGLVQAAHVPAFYRHHVFFTKIALYIPGDWLGFERRKQRFTTTVYWLLKWMLRLGRLPKKTSCQL